MKRKKKKIDYSKRRCRYRKKCDAYKPEDEDCTDSIVCGFKDNFRKIKKGE